MTDQMADYIANTTDPDGIERQPAQLPVATDSSVSRRENRDQRPIGVIDEILVAEVFLVQATIESANALGEGFQAARKAFYGDGEMGEVLKRTQRDVFEPYRDRFQLFRSLQRKHQA